SPGALFGPKSVRHRHIPAARQNPAGMPELASVGQLNLANLQRSSRVESEDGCIHRERADAVGGGNTEAAHSEISHVHRDGRRFQSATIEMVFGRDASDLPIIIIRAA